MRFARRPCEHPHRGRAGGPSVRYAATASPRRSVDRLASRSPSRHGPHGRFSRTRAACNVSNKRTRNHRQRKGLATQSHSAYAMRIRLCGIRVPHSEPRCCRKVGTCLTLLEPRFLRKPYCIHSFETAPTGTTRRMRGSVSKRQECLLFVHRDAGVRCGGGHALRLA